MPFRPLSQLPAETVEWLIPSRLALRHLAILDGDPGLGKSLITLDLCARLTTGQPFFDGSASGGPVHVVLANAEDRPRAEVHARLLAAGADIRYVTVWDREPGEPLLSLPSRTQELDDILKRTSAKLVVLDPILAFLDRNVNPSSDPSVRRALNPLAELADRHRCLILFSRHLNKDEGSRALYRGLYSIAFSAMCRCGWLVAPDPKIRDQYILSQAKNNLDPPQESWAYRIVKHSTGQPRIEWLGPTLWKFDDLTSSGRATKHMCERAADFLRALLQPGPRLVREISLAAEQYGFSEATLRRAKKDLKIETERIGKFGKDHKAYWLLPGQELPKELYPEGTDEVRAWLRRLEEQYPEPTPLERAEDEELFGKDEDKEPEEPDED